LDSTVIILIPPLLPLTGLGISLGVEHDLRGPVPPGGNILREETSVVMLRVCYPGQTKVTDLWRDSPEPQKAIHREQAINITTIY